MFATPGQGAARGPRLDSRAGLEVGGSTRGLSDGPNMPPATPPMTSASVRARMQTPSCTSCQLGSLTTTRFTRTRRSDIVHPVSSSQLTETRDRVRSFGGYNKLILFDTHSMRSGPSDAKSRSCSIAGSSSLLPMRNVCSLTTWKDSTSKLMDMIAAIVGALDERELFQLIISHTGRQHARFGVKSSHFVAFGDALI